MQRPTLTVICSTIAASGATLLLALTPALTPVPAVAHAQPQVVELPRVVVTGTREARPIELPRVVIEARRAKPTRTVVASAGAATQPVMAPRGS
ncbi:MAG TPA: hypothetical protein VLI72_08725 [Methylibium sp.]|nr:hypothetical protein [Methylibium sp.]